MAFFFSHRPQNLLFPYSGTVLYDHNDFNSYTVTSYRNARDIWTSDVIMTSRYVICSVSDVIMTSRYAFNVHQSVGGPCPYVTGTSRRQRHQRASKREHTHTHTDTHIHRHRHTHTQPVLDVSVHLVEQDSGIHSLHVIDVGQS